MSRSFQSGVGYVFLHQSYSGIGSSPTHPNSNREFVSVSYQFTRALEKMIMEETQEELGQSEGLDIQRYLQIVKRRHIHFLVPLFFGWLLVWGASWVLPARYKSSTLILVEQPTMPKNYVESNVSDDLQNRLQSITQQILSRTRLLLIIDTLHLYGDGRRHLAPDEKVEFMRKDIDIVLVRDAHDDQITAFKISYSAMMSHIAQRVTSELSSLFIDDNLQVRQQQSEAQPSSSRAS